MKTKNTAKVLVRCLEAEGVSYIFGVPGEENLAFLEAIRKSKYFYNRSTRTSAAFMGATFGRITGKVVLFFLLGSWSYEFAYRRGICRAWRFPNSLLLEKSNKKVNKENSKLLML